MRSSGNFKRGLAYTAVSALAVTGIPFVASTAHAEPFTAQYEADEVQLVSQFSGAASIKNDGQNTTVRLEAVGGSDVSAVTFQYNTGNPDAWVDITTVNRNDDGAFSYEWDATALAGATVSIRALAVNGTTADPDANDTRTGVVINGGGSTVPAVNLNDGSALGAFQAPYTGTFDDDNDPATPAVAAPGGDYVVLSGTASEAGAVALSRFGPDGEPIAAGTAQATVADGATTATFSGVADIAGYDFTGSPDEAAFGAALGSDDVEAYSLYQQDITTVTATAEDTTIPGNEDTAPVVVTVEDQNGNPIANAEVRNSDGDLVGYTDGQGQVTADQAPGTTYYYANATDSDPFEPGLGDERSQDVTITQYVPTPTALEATSRDGAAFDFDENNTLTNGVAPADSDITVQVEDQNGNAIDTNGQTLSYYWVATPFNGDDAVRYPAGTADWESTESATDEGQYDVAFPQGGVEGTYELFASLSEVPVQGGGDIAESRILTVKAGEAEITYDEASPETGPAGGQEVVDGQLVLDDGTGLAGREIALTLSSNPGADTGDDATPDAHFVNPNGTAAGSTVTVTTGANGGFSATVEDQEETPQQREIGTNIAAETVPATTDNDEPEAATASHVVNFLVNVTPASIEISDQDAPLESPGEVETFTVTVMSGDQDPTTDGVQSVPLTNESVTLTTDHGYFTDGEPVVTAGGDQGVFDDDGQTKTVTTNADGEATFSISIGRDEGFDDDGLVTSLITATAGQVSDTQQQDWTSATPLNGGEVRLEFSPESEQDAGNPLPTARPGSEVELDVFVEDQFGNLVGGETVELSDDTTDADISATSVESDFDSNGDFSATADEEEEQTITASWTTSTATYSTATPPAEATGSETLTDSITINWSEANVTEEGVTMTASPDGRVPVGTAVTETVTVVDDEGNPVPGISVTFTQSGPGEANRTETFQTNADGQAFFVVNSDERGDALVTAVVRAGGAPITRTDTVTYAPARFVPNLVLKGKNNGPRADRLKAKTRRVLEGTTVKLFRFRRNGKRVLVATDDVNKWGNAKFRVRDRNGNRRTKYKAIIVKTDISTRARSNNRRVR